MMMMMMCGEDSYKIPMMADDEVLVVVWVAPTANQDKQAKPAVAFKPLHSLHKAHSAQWHIDTCGDLDCRSTRHDVNETCSAQYQVHHASLQNKCCTTMLQNGHISAEICKICAHSVHHIVVHTECGGSILASIEGLSRVDWSELEANYIQPNTQIIPPCSTNQSSIPHLILP